MFGLAICAIDAVALMGLLRLFTDEDLDFVTGFLFSIATAVGLNVMAMLMDKSFGILGVFAALAIAPVAIGMVVSMLYGAEIKRSFLIGVVFVAVHIVLILLVGFMLGQIG